MILLSLSQIYTLGARATHGTFVLIKTEGTFETLGTCETLLCTLHEMFPRARICGHHDLPGVKKACPCFDAEKEYAYLLN